VALEALRELEREALMGTYARQPVEFVRGEGTRLWDADGNEYLDFLSGISVTQLGHCHPDVVEAVREQAGRLMHVGNLFYTEPAMRLAARLAESAMGGKVFFANSGAEAIECAIKLARRRKPGGGFVVLEGGFHGRTMGALSATWDVHYRAPFAPLLADVTFVAPDDVAGLRRAVTNRTAAIIAEPIQGEGGVRPLSQRTADAITEACEATGALLIADEVQSGLGRTGRAFCSTAIGLKPDVMAIGKALGAGVPIAAALLSERVAARVAFGDHGSTYGGNLLACRAALVFLEELTNGLMAHVERIGRHLEEVLRDLASRHACVRDVRGAGVMWGIELDRPAAPVVEAALGRGLLINRTADTVLRLLPPYVITRSDVDQMVELLEASIAEVCQEVSSR
jgi:predicted acetylornithine/succinylornithine family transaminase